MNLNSLKVALRYFRAADRYSLLNILGLTVGISLFVLMVMLLHYELSYDAFHSNKKRFYRFVNMILNRGNIWPIRPCPCLLL